MKHLKLYEHFYKPLITLSRESTGQEIELDESESNAGNDAIDIALQSESIGDDIGLVAPDFTVSVFGKELEVYSQGQIIKDEQGQYHNFEYGKKWYDMFEGKLKDTLKESPRHFLGESWPHTSTPDQDAYMEENAEYQDALIDARSLLIDCDVIIGNAIQSVRPDNRPEDEPNDFEKRDMIDKVRELSIHLQAFLDNR